MSRLTEIRNSRLCSEFDESSNEEPQTPTAGVCATPANEAQVFEPQRGDLKKPQQANSDVVFEPQWGDLTKPRPKAWVNGTPSIPSPEEPALSKAKGAANPPDQPSLSARRRIWRQRHGGTARRSRTPTCAMADLPRCIGVLATPEHGQDARGTKSSRLTKNLGGSKYRGQLH